MNDLIKKIVEARKSRNLSQDELATELKIDRRYIMAVERGDKVIEALIKVLEGLGIEVVFVEKGKVPMFLDKGVWNDVKVLVGETEGDIDLPPPMPAEVKEAFAKIAQEQKKTVLRKKEPKPDVQKNEGMVQNKKDERSTFDCR